MTLPSWTGRRYWARRLLDAAKGAALPTYGSAEWLALPEGDAVKIAAVIVAAESWARLGDDLPGRLTLEVESARMAHKVAEDVEYAERAAAHREQWSGRTTRGMSFIQRRALQLADAQPRPGDHPGRGAGA